MKKQAPFHSPHRQTAGGALLIVLVLLLVMGMALGVMHTTTNGVGRLTQNNAEILQGNAAAEAAMETVIGRFIQWVNANTGYVPSIADCATTGVPGNATFPAITSAITFPTSSRLSSYTVSTPQVAPVLPDDTIVTSTSDPKYLPNLGSRINVSENSANSVMRYYFTKSATQNAKNVPARSVTYKLSVTVTPTTRSFKAATPITITRYLRCDKVNPFQWCTFRYGSANYTGASTHTYTGPLYLAGSVTFNGPTYTDSVLYGVSATNNGSTFSGGGYTAQVKQTALLSLIPNLVSNLATDTNGARQTSLETNTTSPGVGLPLPADRFSTREVIEPPTNPANDTTPVSIRDARIYTQADVRVKVSVATVAGVKIVTKSVVNVDGTTVNAVTNPWVTPLLAAVNVKTLAASDSNAFMDRSRSTTAAIQSTDVDVGRLTTVMNANASTFPTGIVYIWDDTGLGSGTRPLTGVRLWNAGVLPDTGLVVGTNDPVYLKGDYNTGATLPTGYTIDSTPSVLPPTSSTVARNSGSTTEAQRAVAGYTPKPAGVFGDAVIELSNAWRDANSRATSTASSTTINLVEGWSTMSANELRSDDTYQDSGGRANPIWIENWGSARRTMSGEEMVVWHSKYCGTLNQGVGGNWQGDVSYNPKVAAINLNWGSVHVIRDRSRRD